MTTLNSVGSSLVPASAGGAPAGKGILQTQLARYEVQLADWCNCPSGKSSEGKAKIADLQQKADAAKAQIKQIDDAKAKAATFVAPATEVAKTPNVEITTKGSQLDLYA